MDHCTEGRVVDVFGLGRDQPGSFKLICLTPNGVHLVSPPESLCPFKPSESHIQYTINVSPLKDVGGQKRTFAGALVCARLIFSHYH